MAARDRVKPDGNALFVAWNDRRGDTANNSLIDVYGRFATIDNNGTVQFPGSDFRITTESSPPAFPGTLVENEGEGHYDPVWPPGGIPLDWWYGSEDTEPPGWWPLEFGEPIDTFSVYAFEAGEHNGAFATDDRVFVVWSDNRSHSQGTRFAERHQTDVRSTRVPWPTQ